MALPKKGSRRITIENEVYRFLVTLRNKKIEALAELDNASGQRLHVITTLESGNAFTPAMMRQCIETAIEKGWKPSEKGNEFVLRADEATFVR